MTSPLPRGFARMGRVRPFQRHCDDLGSSPSPRFVLPCPLSGAEQRKAGNVATGDDLGRSGFCPMTRWDLPDSSTSGKVTPRGWLEQVAAGIDAVNPEIERHDRRSSIFVVRPLSKRHPAERRLCRHAVPDRRSFAQPSKAEAGDRRAVIRGTSLWTTASTTKIRQAGLNIIGRRPAGSVSTARLRRAGLRFARPWTRRTPPAARRPGRRVVASGVIPISHASDGGGAGRASPPGSTATSASKAVTQRLFRRRWLRPLRYRLGPGCHTRRRTIPPRSSTPAGGAPQ